MLRHGLLKQDVSFFDYCCGTGIDLEILSGLDAGDRVVIDKPGELLDGQPVTVQ